MQTGLSSMLTPIEDIISRFSQCKFRMHRLYVCFVLILPSFLTQVQVCNSDCVDTYHTLCSDFADLKKIPKEEAALKTEIIIGNENRRRNELHDLRSSDDLPFQNFHNLRYLVLINQVKSLPKYGLFNTYYAWNLNIKDAYLYKNSLNRIKTNTFMYVKLSKLSLVDNQIDFIQKGAFTNCQTDIIDLSENNIDVLEVGVFEDSTIKQLFIEKNNIEMIESGTLPNTLEILNLDHNKLENEGRIQEALTNLDNLKELYLADNDITHFPSKLNLSKLEILDLSHNKLKAFVRGSFNKFTRLQLLDLSHNAINEFIESGQILIKTKSLSNIQLQLSLAFNRLGYLNATTLENLKPYTLFLAGNPWNCKCWDEMANAIMRKRINWNSCDREFFTKAITPYCIPYNLSAECVEYAGGRVNELYSEEDYEKFSRVVERTKKDIKCSLKPIRQIADRDYVKYFIS